MGADPGEDALRQITIITDRAAPVDAEADPSRGTFLIDPADLPPVLGWALTPSGLCRDDACVPVRDLDAIRVGDRLDVAAVAAAVGRPSVVDVPAGIVAVALPAELRRRALAELDAPTFTLPDLDGVPHALDEWSGRKKLLVAFSSWCGCRYDLPGWQALHDELAPDGFTVIAVAIDQHADEVLARLHFRVAAEAHRRGDGATTRAHVLRAGELAPDDLTVWRAGMPLLGEDPFGGEFLERYDAWRAKGSPAHSLPSVRSARGTGPGSVQE